MNSSPERDAAVQAAIKRITDQARARMRSNELAAHTSFGGRWTAKGLERANHEADLNGMDRIMIKNMVGTGLGGSFPGMGGM